MTRKEKTQIAIVIEKLDTLLSYHNQEVNEPTGLNYTDLTPQGGIRIKEVDQLVTNWLLSGDPLKRKVAENTAEYYCFLSPDSDKTMTPDVINQVRANQNRLWAVSNEENIDYMYDMKPLYVHRDGTESWSQPKSLIFGGWKRVQKRQGKKVLNHAVVSNGNYSNPKNPKWQTELRNKIAGWVENKMLKDLGNFQGSE